jgi:hypothetical protein
MDEEKGRETGDGRKGGRKPCHFLTQCSKDYIMINNNAGY